MGNKLEQLLNTLIERGWKPFWKSNRWNVTIDDTIKTKSPFFDFDYHNMSVSTRELISKESGLWQFVCENKMIELETDSWDNDGYYRCYYNCDGYPKDYYFDVERDDYRFRLIESSLKDESELESFILDNIKV